MLYSERWRFVRENYVQKKRFAFCLWTFCPDRKIWACSGICWGCGYFVAFRQTDRRNPSLLENKFFNELFYRVFSPHSSTSFPLPVPARIPLIFLMSLAARTPLLSATPIPSIAGGSVVIHKSLYICHPRESGDPVWIPACAGMTSINKEALESLH